MRTWHVIGNSRSILEEDFSNLHPSIGVNRILRYMQPDYVLIVDSDVQEEERRRVSRFKGKLISWECLRWGRPDVIKFGVTERHTHMTGFTGLYSRAGNTGHYAMEFAARRIYPRKGRIILHGMDFKIRRDQPSHFFGNKKKTGTQKWPEQVERIKKSAEFLRRHGISVLNGSPWKDTPIAKILPAWKHRG